MSVFNFKIIRGPSLSSSKGATMVEFSLAFPLLCIFILMLFDFCRILAVRSSVRSSLERALSLATVKEGLDSACYRFTSGSLEETECLDKQDDALNEVLNLAKNFSLKTWVGLDASSHPVFFVDGDQNAAAVELVLRPDNTEDGSDDESRVFLATGKDSTMGSFNFNPNAPFSDGSSLQAVLQREPMQMRARVVVQTFVSSILSYVTGKPSPLSFTVLETVAAYREPRQQTSLPQRIDCMGVPLAQGEISIECPRDGEPCPLPFILDEDSDLCQCPNTSAEEAGCVGSLFDPSRCDCLPTDAECPPSLPLESDEGVCSPCPETAKQDCNDSNGIFKEPCSCKKCPELYVPHPANQEWCVCDVEAAAAKGCLHIEVGTDGVSRPNCRCDRDCPTSGSFPGPNGDLDACFCEIDEDCVAQGFEFDRQKCQCLNTLCPGDSVLNEVNGDCSCPAERRCFTGPTDWVNCGCQPCPDGEVLVNDDNGVPIACGPTPQCSNDGCSVINGQLIIPE